MSNIESFIPYEVTAKVIARGDESVEQFVQSVFPTATPEQIDKFVHFAAGLIHDGMEYGMGISDVSAANSVELFGQAAEEALILKVGDGLSSLEAYRLGVEDGINRATDFRRFKSDSEEDNGDSN